MEVRSSTTTRRRSLTKIVHLVLVILQIQLALSQENGINRRQNKSMSWGKVDVEETDIPDDFDFATMSFKRLASPFSDQHLEVDEKLENEEEEDVRYTYDPNHKYGPHRWVNYFPQCGGRKDSRQSPMDLSSCKNATQMSHLRLTEMNTRPIEIALTNNGHSIQYAMQYPDGNAPLLSGGPLKSKYRFEQLHFHWGLKNSEGSEHTIDSRASSMEMHLLFRNTKYEDVKEAVDYRDGLAVLGFLFEVSDTEPIGYLKNLDQLREVGSTVIIRGMSTGFRMKDIIKSLQQDFIAYQGSLTTPPCSEAVSWLVARQPMKIAKHDMIAFRKIYAFDEMLMAPNFRPIQNRNKRFCLNF